MLWCTALYSSPEQQASSVRQSQTGLLFSHYNKCSTGVTLCPLRPQTSMIIILTHGESPDISIREFCLSPVRRGGECPGDPAQCVA